MLVAVPLNLPLVLVCDPPANVLDPLLIASNLYNDNGDHVTSPSDFESIS